MFNEIIFYISFKDILVYFVFFFIILIVNSLHRLQSIVSEILILVTLIITILYSPIYLPFKCKSFFRILSVKNYLLDHFLYNEVKSKFFKDISEEHCFLKNYFLYHEHEIKGVVHAYIVSTVAQTFFQILSDNKVIDINEINILINQYPILNNLKLGQMISLIIVKGHVLQSLLWQVSSKESRIYNRVAFSGNFIENIIMKINGSEKWYHLMIMGRLHDNFINSICSLGVNRNNIQKMIESLQWQLNFRKLRIGDNFSMLIICSKNCDSKNFEVISQVVTAIRLHNFGKDYYAFRADNGRFYNREAIGIAHDFIRFPTIKPFRVSSNFNLNRLNPITGRISPHFGVDFAVPIGTPVLSIADGRVINSQYGQKSGNYIAIRHNSHCVSRYMHLNRLLVKPGQVVKKGENIAFSGNTGRSTGPHLHFELWVNHKPVNPLTATFLNFETLHGCDRVNYINKVNLMLPYLHN